MQDRQSVGCLIANCLCSWMYTARYVVFHGIRDRRTRSDCVCGSRGTDHSWPAEPL